MTALFTQAILGGYTHGGGGTHYNGTSSVGHRQLARSLSGALGRLWTLPLAETVPHPRVPWSLIPRRPTWRSGSNGHGEPRVPASPSGKRRQKVLLALGFAFSALRSEHSTSQFCFLIKL